MHVIVLCTRQNTTRHLPYVIAFVDRALSVCSAADGLVFADRHGQCYAALALDLQKLRVSDSKDELPLQQIKQEYSMMQQPLMNILTKTVSAVSTKE